MLTVEVEDGSGSGNRAKVTEFGQLVTAPLDFSQSILVDMTSVDTAYNMTSALEDSRVVITGLVISANNQVSSTDGALIEIYEADSPTSTSVTRSLFVVNLIKNQIVPIVPMNLLTGSGVWINAKTNDASVSVTLIFYYVS